MAYAQNDIREVWDNIGKPSLFEFDCEEFGTVLYIPYLAKTILARNAGKYLKDLKLQYPVGVYNKELDMYQGTKGLSIDLHITYACNLTCANCNVASHIKHYAKGTNKSMEFILKFIEEYKHYGKDMIVKILGGEPTVHPLLRDFMEELNKHFTVWVLTNGIKPYDFPDYVYVENSSKIKDVNPEFHTTFVAAIDDPRFKDVTDEQYSKGCDVLACGYGYNETGLHPCVTGMALNRILKLRTGYANKQECDKNKADYLTATCKMCGLFKKLGSHNVDKAQFKRVTDNVYSDSWSFMKNVK